MGVVGGYGMEREEIREGTFSLEGERGEGRRGENGKGREG